MRIHEEELDGFKTCGRSRIEHGHCEGYASVPAKVIRQVVEKTFGDLDGRSTPADPYFHMPANSYEYILPATPEDAVCDSCGHSANVSLAPRSEYPRQPNTESPDAIVEKLAREREEKDESMSIAERQAAAMEKLAAQGEEASRVAQLEAQLAELVKRLPPEKAKS